MKKKIILIIILAMFIWPTHILAGDDCTTCGEGGPVGGGTGSSGEYVPPSTGSSCPHGKCVWGVGGVRISLYTYNAGGTPVKIGSSVDIYSEKYYKTNNMEITSPKTDSVLTDRKNCTLTEITTSEFPNYAPYQSWDQYTSENKVFSYNIYNDLYQGKISQWLYNKDTGKGWLEDSVFSKIKNRDFASVNELFSIENEKYLQENLSDVYIVAELLIQMKKDGGDTLWSGSYLWTGTVGEMAETFAYRNLTNRLYITHDFSPIGELVGEGGASAGFYLPTMDGPWEKWGLFLVSVGEDMCDTTYGMAVWYMPDCCPECTPPTCSNACGEYSTGTMEHLACAQSWCKVNDSENQASCVSACIPNDAGCDEAYNDTCAQFTENNVKKPMSITGSVCTDNNFKETESLASKVCYDDEQEYSTTNIKYYKIECKEYVDLGALPTERTVYINSLGTGDLYLGYELTYKKKCDLYYKHKDADKENATVKWTQQYAKSKLREDIVAYCGGEYDANGKFVTCGDYNNKGTEVTGLKDKYQELVKNETDAEKKAEYQEMLSYLQKSYDEIKGVRAFALDELERVSAVDYDESKMINNEVALEVYSSSSGKVEKNTIKLVPVTCFPDDSEKEYCDLATGVGYYYTNKGSVVCSSESNMVVTQDQNKIPDMDNSTSIPPNTKLELAEFNKETSTKDANTSSEYVKTVSYALPSTWISVIDASIYHGTVDESDNKIYDSYIACAQAHGLENCKESENVWVFEPLDKKKDKTYYNSLTADENFKLVLNNYGSCGQFNYDLSCGYTFEDASYCSKCSQYTYGTEAYNKCAEEKCGCDSICGSQVSCRAAYCPEECEGCDDEKIIFCPDDACLEKCTTNGTTDVSCKWDECCAKKCMDGDCECKEKCCFGECKERYGEGTEAYNTCTQVCINNKRSCDKGDGIEYVYRPINMNNPFPDRDPGMNWYGKVGYITDSQNGKDIYKDDTDGKTDSFEYKITLTADDLEKIKNDEILNTTYLEFKRSENYSAVGTNSEQEVTEYCSWVLYDYLEKLDIQIERGSSANSGSGCKEV